LKARLAAADQRQQRERRRHLREAIEEGVFRPEDHCRAQHGGSRQRRLHHALAFELRARIVRAFRPSAKRRDVHHLGDAAPRSSFSDRLRAFDVHCFERLLAAIGQHADQIDHRVRAFERRVDRFREARVGLHQLHLADIAGHAQRVAQVRPAHRYAHARAALGQRSHHLLSDEPRTAENNDQLAVHAHAPSPRNGRISFRLLKRSPPLGNSPELGRYGLGAATG